MKINIDRPIKNSKGDLLGRIKFVDTIVELIENYEENESFVVGVFGGWGSGKTSVINMVVDKLIDRSDNKNIIVNFSPWNYSSQNDLIGLFFNELKHSVRRSKHRIVTTVTKAIENYLEVVEAIPQIGSYVKPIKSWMKKKESLEKSKKDLIEKLKKIDSRIIVVIDDIDRLNDHQIKEIFQLIKQIGDLPNIFYLLSLDRKRVISALNNMGNEDGEAYLEKIIQLPLVLPEISEDDMRRLFYLKFEQAINENSFDGISYNIEFLSHVYSNCIALFLNNLRDINRIINVFINKLRILKGSVYIEELLAMSTMEVMEPNLYKWIYAYRDNLCSDVHSKPIFTSEIYKQKLKLNNIDIDRAQKSICSLFPEAANRMGQVSRVMFSNEWRDQFKSIAQSHILNKVFRNTPEKRDIEKSFIENVIFNFDSVDIRNNLSKISQPDVLETLIKESIERECELSSCRKIFLINLILESCKDSHPGNEEIIRQGLFFHISKLIEANKELPLKSVLKDAISCFNLGIIFNVMEEVRLTESQISELLTIQESIPIDKTFFCSKYSKSVFNFLELNSKENYIELIKKILKDNILILKLISLYAQENKNNKKETFWTFNSPIYSNYLSEESILDKIDGVMRVFRSEFEKKEKIKIAAFYLYKKCGECDSITTEKAKEKCKEWEEYLSSL